MKPRILIVDDDRVILRGLAETLERSGCETVTATSGDEAMQAYAQEVFDLVLLDVRLPDRDGLEVLGWVLDQDSDQLVIMMTAYADASVAVQAMKAGAHDYIHKPFDLDELRVLISRALEVRRMRGELLGLRYQHSGHIPLHELIGSSPAMHRIRSLVQKVSATPKTSVLIQGESGTGKERVAHAIHYQSRRRDFPLLKINCSTIPQQLMESELFGYEKGAFTDAKASKKGLLEMAHGGTVLLDEVGDLHPVLQPKLLRFLETHAFQRVGGLREIQVDVRIVAATHRDLKRMVQEGSFREDLYYRLTVMCLEIPSLRDRRDDVLMLAEYFLQEISRELGVPIEGLSREVTERLLRYPWPGNARELRNVLERAAILASSPVIRPEHLKLDLPVVPAPESPIRALPLSEGQDLTLERVQREHILRILQWVGGNKSEAARRLGISRSTLQEHLKAYSGGKRGPRARRVS
jgi:DNA-binding NtrC family response regulator